MVFNFFSISDEKSLCKYPVVCPVLVSEDCVKLESIKGGVEIFRRWDHVLPRKLVIHLE